MNIRTAHPASGLRTRGKSRFTKAVLTEHLGSIMDNLERAYGFKPGDGWVVVERRPTDVQVAFGRYDLARDLLEDLDGGHL
jgi:hypothetical protein